MVIINRRHKDSCENSHVCYCCLLDSHGVQSGAVNTQCNIKVMHLGPLKSRRRMYILYYILYILFKSFQTYSE